MGIQNYLRRVSSATKDIKSAIEEKGVPVSQCDGLEALADRVRAIQTGSTEIPIEQQMFVLLAFRQSSTTPAVPTGGYFSAENITYPTGWSDGAGLTENIWMSYCIIKGDGSFYKNWVSPIKISSGSSSTGPEIDLTDYALKSWVTNEIAKVITGGTLDLSNYYTKSEVDSKISNIEISSGVASVNDITGKVTLQGSSSVNISKSGNTLTFTASGGSTPDGDAYITKSLYKAHSSDEVAPSVSSAATIFNTSTKELENLPYGWANAAIKTTENPYIWKITGAFSTTTGARIGSWEGPVCITGDKGDPGQPGDPGKDGNATEEVYALCKTKYTEDQVTVDNTSANADGAHTTGGYLPYFSFNGIRTITTASPSSVSADYPYQWMSKRHKKIGTSEWGDFSSPVLYNNYTMADVEGDIKAELIETATGIAEQAVTNATKDIQAAKDGIDRMEAALGYKDGTYTKINQYDKDSNSLNTELGTVEGYNGREGTILSNLTQLYVDANGLLSSVSDQSASLASLSTQTSVLKETAEAIRAQVSALETNLKNKDSELFTSGILVNKDYLNAFTTKTDFYDLDEGYLNLTSKVNSLANASGQYLVKTVVYPKYSADPFAAYVTDNGDIILATNETLKDEKGADLKYGNVVYYSPSGIVLDVKEDGTENTINYWRYSDKEKKIIVAVEDSEASASHPIGTLKTDTEIPKCADVNNCTDEENTAITTVRKQNENNAVRNAREITEYATLLIDTVAGIYTSIENNSPEVALRALSEDGTLASFVLGCKKAETDPETGKVKYIPMIETNVQEMIVNGKITASELIAEGEQDGEKYAVNIGPIQDTSSSKLYFNVPTYSDTGVSRHHQSKNFVQTYKFTLTEDGYKLAIPKISIGSFKLHLVTSGTVSWPKFWYSLKNTTANTTIVTTSQVTVKPSNYSGATVSGTGDGVDYYPYASISENVFENLKAGEYTLEIHLDAELLGANAFHASQWAWNSDSFSMIATKSSEGLAGVFLGGNGLKIKSNGSSTDAEVVNEVSLSNTGQEIVSSGLVISPTINKIAVVETLPASPAEGTIYIILA